MMSQRMIQFFFCISRFEIAVFTELVSEERLLNINSIAYVTKQVYIAKSIICILEVWLYSR